MAYDYAYHEDVVIRATPTRQPGFPPRIVMGKPICPAGHHLQGGLCVADEYLPHATPVDYHEVQPPPPMQSMAGRGDGTATQGVWAPPRNPLAGPYGAQEAAIGPLASFIAWAKAHPYIVGGIVVGTLLVAAAGKGGK